MALGDVLDIRSNKTAALLAIRRDATTVSPHPDLNDGYWVASLSCGTLEASLRFYEIELGGLADYFAGLAAEWRGWADDRGWESLEGDLALVATHDGLGTITLTARLRTEVFATHRWDASADLLLDAGSLDQLTRQAKRLVRAA